MIINNQILNGKTLAATIKNELAEELKHYLARGYRPPRMVVVLVGEDAPSMTYVASKEKSSIEIGFTSSVLRLPEDITEDELLKVVDALNEDDEVDGFIVQLPLPLHLNEKRVLHAIAAEKDVDGFTPTNTGLMVLGEDTYLPPNIMGVCTMFERYNINSDGKHVVIVGSSNIACTPTATLISSNAKHANCSITICNYRSHNLAEITRQADILIVDINHPNFITADMVKEGVVLIDVGIHRIPDASRPSGYHLTGDVDHAQVDQLCSWYTPVPGGVGPMTIVSLLQNTMKAYKRKFQL
ncbi:MAG: bifunctional 5,10-methylenetetrahydrofolate dehydrogenase/5,10-methenyltetrahydrofolate cyclohydrolase [Bacteroidales bacterium]|nr:bifunctional 5,10-methylenetetrahydrofolate dehydrogenase/5,10-methenyltetrahydrofolate cyclohydrolase [Bacteroidales bacterium]